MSPLAVSLLVVCLLAVLLLVAAAPGFAAGKKLKSFEPELLLNPFLSPAYAQWLVGPIARIADEDEAEAYLRLTDDTQAAAFIEAFWQKRDPDPQQPGNPLRDTFDQRVADADRLYSEGAYAGHHTDRGTIYVLYGEPESLDYDVAPYEGGPPIHIWRYPKKAPAGLDGREPSQSYRFIKHGDLTVFYTQRLARPDRPLPPRLP